MATEIVLHEVPPKAQAYDLSLYSPEHDEQDTQMNNAIDASTSLASLQKNDEDVRASEESNLLGGCVDVVVVDDDDDVEGEKVGIHLSKSQRLMIYKQVENDPESSDEEEEEIVIDSDDTEFKLQKIDPESSWEEERDWNQEYTGLEEDETYEWVDFQTERHSVDCLETFETNVFQNLYLHDGDFISIIKDDEEIVAPSDIEFEDMVPIQLKSVGESTLLDPMSKFAKSIPLIKPPPPEKVAAYLESKSIGLY